MTPLRFYLIIITASFMIIGCGEKKKKVHTQFDTVEIVNQSNDSLNDSAKSGGLGFEKYADNDGWVTNNNITITGDPKAIKGDTITIVADDVFPPNFRGFGKDSRTQLNSLLEGMVYEYPVSYTHLTLPTILLV